MYGILNIPKEDLETHLPKKYTDPLTNIPLGRFVNLIVHIPSKKNLTIHLWNESEKLELRGHRGSMISTKDALKY